MTAAACRSCGRPVIACPATRESCAGWVHEQDSAHRCFPGGREEASPAPREERPWPVSGRDQPRTRPQNGSCDVRFTGPIRVTCTACPGYAVTLADEHSLAFLARVQREHSGHAAEDLLPAAGRPEG